MSLYNMIAGFNPACFWIMPMLGRKQEEWPRFRDCFLGENGDTIVIYTRVGGGNRNTGYNENQLYNDPNFLRTWDDSYDSTYGYYEFSVPERWKDDFSRIISGHGKDISEEYKAVLLEFFPKLTPKVFQDLAEKEKKGDITE